MSGPRQDGAGQRPGGGPQPGERPALLGGPAGSRGPAGVHLRTGEHGGSVLPSLYDEVGGQAAFDALVTAFYERVRRDPLLWPMYPQDDLAGAIRRLSLFLAQFFGGPGTYSEERGHPRLRLRHRPFRIDREAREHWLAHMREALEEVSAAGLLTLSPARRASMLDYFDRASLALINTP